MTEERKIITEEDWSWGASRIGWNDLEPAPPKDWRPICYDSQYNKLNGCDPMPPIVKACRQCPFLADRHKTQNLDKNLDINQGGK
jgi:hypothetical protein